ncbi:MAG: hypothetical protein L6R40_005418 [Gallowayella cf. fulva]|nr:MAG: hypothetical protein L6R40_005418 [Xanthomendoza cf. fulva]
MSVSKSSHLVPTSSASEPPPPSYSQSINTSPLANLFTPRVTALIDAHIAPHLDGTSTSTLVLVPSNVTSLFHSLPSCSTEKDTSSAFPRELLIGFPSDENPTITRLPGPDNRLEFWQRAAALRELGRQLRARLRAEGHEIVLDPFQRDVGVPDQIASSEDAGWRSVEQRTLRAGEARVEVALKDVCLRIENDMGLYETRTGKGIVVSVKYGVREDDDWVF